MMKYVKEFFKLFLILFCTLNIGSFRGVTWLARGPVETTWYTENHTLIFHFEFLPTVCDFQDIRDTSYTWAPET